MYMVFIIGTAGSGKSRLTAAYSDWLKMSKQDVAIVNLDPGVSVLPYSPEVDVRDYVDVGNLMEQYNLGPNGALIMAAEMHLMFQLNSLINAPFPRNCSNIQDRR